MRSHHDQVAIPFLSVGDNAFGWIVITEMLCIVQPKMKAGCARGGTAQVATKNQNPEQIYATRLMQSWSRRVGVFRTTFCRSIANAPGPHDGGAAETTHSVRILERPNSPATIRYDRISRHWVRHELPPCRVVAVWPDANSHDRDPAQPIDVARVPLAYLFD